MKTNMGPDSRMEDYKVIFLFQGGIPLLHLGFGECTNGTCVRNTIEFQNRELNTGSFPKGLALLFAANNNWNYDKDCTSGYLTGLIQILLAA